jgi:hypothetical protein
LLIPLRFPEHYSQQGERWPRKPSVSATVDRKITAGSWLFLLAVPGCFLAAVLRLLILKVNPAKLKVNYYKRIAAILRVSKIRGRQARSKIDTLAPDLVH